LTDPRQCWVAGGSAGRVGALRRAGRLSSQLKAIMPPAGEAGPRRRLHHWREREGRDGWRKRHRGEIEGPHCRTFPVVGQPRRSPERRRASLCHSPCGAELPQSPPQSRSREEKEKERTD